MADNAAQQKTETFADYGVRQDISDALAAVGITTPFPIQTMALPVALAGHDIIKDRHRQNPRLWPAHDSERHRARRRRLG